MLKKVYCLNVKWQIETLKDFIEFSYILLTGL